MARRGKGLDPDVALEISLSGTARRLACSDVLPSEAIRELRELAGGRTDLLSIAAGRAIGGYLGSAQDNPWSTVAAGYLVMAGADPAAVARVADETREAVRRGGHSR